MGHQHKQAFCPTCQQPRLFTRFLNDVPNMGYLLVGGLALLGGMFIPPLLIFVAVIAVLWPAHTFANAVCSTGAVWRCSTCGARAPMTINPLAIGGGVMMAGGLLWWRYGAYSDGPASAVSNPMVMGLLIGGIVIYALSRLWPEKSASTPRGKTAEGHRPSRENQVASYLDVLEK